MLASLSRHVFKREEWIKRQLAKAPTLTVDRWFAANLCLGIEVPPHAVQHMKRAELPGKPEGAPPPKQEGDMTP